MAQIIWNNVAAPNLGESNSLFAQAIQNLKDAGAGLKDTAKDYQTVVRNKSHAILQDYINSAKTPEELQSEAFNIGFKNLQATLANEFDPVKVNEYRDTRGDVLTRRAGDAVALKRNEFGLSQEQLAADKIKGTAELYALRNDPVAYAAKEAELAQANRLNPTEAQNIQLGVYNIKNAKRADDFGNATYDANVENALKAPFATQQTIDASKASVLNQAGMLAVAQKNAESERIRANAARSEGSGKFNFGTSPQGLIAKTEESIRNFEATMQGDKAKAMGDNTANAKTWYDEQVANGDLADGVPKTLYLLTQGKYGDKNKLKGWEDLTPSQKYTALSNAQTRSGLGAEWNVTDKDFEQLKTTLQNEVSGMLQGDVDKRNAYAFAQIDNLLGEAYYRDPTVSKEIVFNTLNIDKNLKSAYLKHKQEQAATAEATNNVVQAGAKPASVIVPTVKKPQVTLGESLNGGSAWFQPKQPQTAPVVTAAAKDVQNSTYTKSPLQIVSEAVTQRPTPLLPAANQNAFKDKANNLSIDVGTGKTTPAKNPVAIPDVTWGKPAQVVTMSPLVAKLPQYKAVATFVSDGDTFAAKSDSYATKGEKAKKAGGILCRVDSVDAPETPHPEHGKKGQPYGEEAGKKLQQMILNKEISIRIVKPANGDPNEVGHYGRDICQIEVSGANVSTELIRSGAAWLYKEYNNYFTGLEAVQADAQANQRGLFGLPNPVYPPTAKHNGSLNLQ